jgi:hypothetical protein
MAIPALCVAVCIAGAILFDSLIAGAGFDTLLRLMVVPTVGFVCAIAISAAGNKLLKRQIG